MSEQQDKNHTNIYIDIGISVQQLSEIYLLTNILLLTTAIGGKFNPLQYQLQYKIQVEMESTPEVWLALLLSSWGIFK